MKRFLSTKIPFLLILFALASCGGSPTPSSSPSVTTSVESTTSVTSENTSEATSEKTTEATSEKTSEGTSEATSEHSAESTYSSTQQQSTDYVISQDPDVYVWNVNFDLYGEAFQRQLGELMNATRTKTISYKQCLNDGAKAAAYPNASSSTFIPFYHEAKDSEKTGIGGCNREHTWPNSRGGGLIETDPIVIRPTLTSDNSHRGNNFYGITGSTWDPASCGYEGARGESARVILYAVTCYHQKQGLSLSNNPNDATGAHTMGTLKTLLEWNRTYQPTDFERTVNERYAAMGHARNAFVDYPELADFIYDENGYRASKYNGPNGGGGGSGTDSGPTYRTYYQQETDLTDLDGNDYILASKTNDAGTSVMTLTSNEKSETLPWYLIGNDGELNNGKLYQTVPPESFRFDKLQSGNYTITAASGDYLYGYVCSNGSKTFNSIGLAKTENEIKATQSDKTFSAISKEWVLIDKGNGDFLLKATSEVYLEFYSGSWCGYKSAPSYNLCLFDPTPETEVI